MSSYSSILRKTTPTRNLNRLQISDGQPSGVLIEKNYCDRTRGVRSSNIRLVDSSAVVKSDDKKKEIASSPAEAPKWEKPIPNSEQYHRQNSFEQSSPQFIHTLQTTHTIVSNYTGSYVLQTQQQQTQSYFNDLEEFPRLGANKPRKRSTSETLSKGSPTDGFFQTSELSPYAKPFIFRGAYQQSTLYNSLNDCSYQQSVNSQENDESPPAENEEEFQDDNENFPRHLTDLKCASISLSRQKYMSNLSVNAKPFEFKKSTGESVDDCNENDNSMKGEQPISSPKKDPQPFVPKKYEQLDFRSAINYSLKSNRNNENKENQTTRVNEPAENNSKDKNTIGNARVLSWRRGSPSSNHSNSKESPSNDDENESGVHKSEAISDKSDKVLSMKTQSSHASLLGSQKPANFPKINNANECETKITKHPLMRVPSYCSNDLQRKNTTLRPDAKPFTVCKPTGPNAENQVASSPNLVASNFQKSFTKRHDYPSQTNANTFYKWHAGSSNSSASQVDGSELPKAVQNKQLFTPRPDGNSFYKWHAGANSKSPSRQDSSSDFSKNAIAMNKQNENGEKINVPLSKDESIEQADFEQNSKMNGWRRGALSKLILNDDNRNVVANALDKALKPNSAPSSQLSNYRTWSDPNGFDGKSMEWRETTNSMSPFITPAAYPFPHQQFGGWNMPMAINKFGTSRGEPSIVENNCDQKFSRAVGTNTLGRTVVHPQQIGWNNNSSQYSGQICEPSSQPAEIMKTSSTREINVKADQRKDESRSPQERSQSKLSLSNDIKIQNGYESKFRAQKFSRDPIQQPSMQSPSREFLSKVEMEGDIISVSKIYPRRGYNEDLEQEDSLIPDRKCENVQDNLIKWKEESCEKNPPRAPLQLLRCSEARPIPPVPTGYTPLAGTVEKYTGNYIADKMQNAASKINQDTSNETSGPDYPLIFKERMNPSTFYDYDYQNDNNSMNESQTLLRRSDPKTIIESNQNGCKPQIIGRRFNPSDNILNLIKNSNLARLAGANSNNIPAKPSMDLEHLAIKRVSEQLKIVNKSADSNLELYNNFDCHGENGSIMSPSGNKLEVVKINTSTLNIYENGEGTVAEKQTLQKCYTPLSAINGKLGAPPPVPPRRGIINKAANCKLETRSLPKPPESTAPVVGKHPNINSIESLVYQKLRVSSSEAYMNQQQRKNHQGMVAPSPSATSHNENVAENESAVVNIYSANCASINSTAKIPPTGTHSATVPPTTCTKISGGTNPFLDDYIEESVDIDAQNIVSSKPAIVDPPKDPLWFYLAPGKHVQGPFTSIEMAEWFNAGYFGEDLVIRRNCDDRFVTVEEFIKLTGSSSPFLESRSVPPMKATLTTINRCTNPFLEFQPAKV